MASTMPAASSLTQGLSQPVLSMGNMAPTVGRLPQLGSSLTQGISVTPKSTSGLFSGMGEYGQKAMDMAMQGMGGGGGGGEQRGPVGPQTPGLHGMYSPYSAMPFSVANYRFRRGPGY